MVEHQILGNRESEEGIDTRLLHTCVTTTRLLFDPTRCHGHFHETQNLRNSQEILT